MAPLPRHAKRRDDNEPWIVTAFEKCGVAKSSIIRIDVPCDLIVGYRGLNLLVEVKNPDRLQGNKDPRTEKQRELGEFDGQIETVETAADVGQLLGRVDLWLDHNPKK